MSEAYRFIVHVTVYACQWIRPARKQQFHVNLGTIVIMSVPQIEGVMAPDNQEGAVRKGNMYFKYSV
jgi:hypothetical protein